MSEPTSAPAERPARRRQVVRIGLGALALVLLLAAAVRERHDLGDAVGRLDVPSVLLAAVLVLAGLVANMLSWRAVLAGLGSPLPVPVASRVFLLAQIGKYLPGSVWPVLAQVELARDHAVPRLRSGLAAVAALLVGMVVGVVVAVACLVPTAQEQAVGWWVVVAAVLGVVIVHPAVLTRVIRFALRLARRPADDLTVDGRALWRSAGWSLAMWAALGSHIYVLARAIGADEPDLFFLSVGAYAAAWTAGLLVVVAPAGAGAREAALVIALAPALARPDALAVALVSRGLTLTGDLVCSAGAVIAARVHERRLPANAAEAGDPAPGAGR